MSDLNEMKECADRANGHHFQKNTGDFLLLVSCIVAQAKAMERLEQRIAVLEKDLNE